MLAPKSWSKIFHQFFCNSLYQFLTNRDSDISRMEKADAQVSDQIEDYGEKLTDRNQEIQGARENLNKVYLMYANAGDNSVANFDQFKQDTIERVGFI